MMIRVELTSYEIRSAVRNAVLNKIQILRPGMRLESDDVIVKYSSSRKKPCQLARHYTAEINLHL
jgi:hypothetical protein